jgi:glyoxylase-like metal-dependent hydrolase (beta-lactamase superfamily II)
MSLEIKILDYGDIELESSFLVLGRDCGRTRRVLTLGFLILGGPHPVLVDTGYRSNQIMETLGMRGLQFHENMIENQLARHGVRMGDLRFVCHTHLHIDHAGKDDLFPMNTTVVVSIPPRTSSIWSIACIAKARYVSSTSSSPVRSN